MLTFLFFTAYSLWTRCHLVGLALSQRMRWRLLNACRTLKKTTQSVQICHPAARSSLRVRSTHCRALSSSGLSSEQILNTVVVAAELLSFLRRTKKWTIHLGGSSFNSLQLSTLAGIASSTKPSASLELHVKENA